MNQLDEEQFREFAASRMDDLRSLAYLTCGDWQAAEDAVSTALTRLYVNWKRVAVPHRYACRVVVNAAIDEKRRPWRREHSALAETLDRAEPDHADGFADRDRIRRALRQVPPGQRAVVVLRYYGDFSVDEVAEMQGLSPGTVKSQTARGLATLRKLLSPQEMPEPDEEEERDERCAPAADRG